MIEERVLALDVSSKTGWAVFVSNDQGCNLECYGQIDQIPEPPGMYPENYVTWAYLNFSKIDELVDAHAPDVLVIEETSAGSKNVYSQKILEFTHFLLAKLIKECNIRCVYLMTEQWRRETGCVQNKSEKDHNKKVKKYKEENETSIAYNDKGKRVGKIGRKHVNVRRANEVFGQFLKTPLRMKDEDTADSLMLGYCYHLRKEKNDKESVAN